MEKFDIQILLKDGTFADLGVHNERTSERFEVFEKDEKLAVFTATPDGGWEVSENNGLDDDMQQRIINQLNGLKS